jgi:hypothetical protein
VTGAEGKKVGAEEVREVEGLGGSRVEEELGGNHIK